MDKALQKSIPINGRQEQWQFSYIGSRGDVQKIAAHRGTHISELPLNARARIVGYNKALAGYQGKLIMMGLTPDTEFVLRQHGDNHCATIIAVGDRQIPLSKPEADALCVDCI